MYGTKYYGLGWLYQFHDIIKMIREGNVEDIIENAGSIEKLKEIDFYDNDIRDNVIITNDLINLQRKINAL